LQLTLVMVGLILVSATTSRAQMNSKANRATAESLTQSLMSLHTQYRTADHTGRAILITQLRSVAAERQQFLSSLIQTSPGEVLRVAIPANIAATLPSSVRSSIEQETDAQGELQVMYEDRKTSAVLHHLLTTGGQRLELKFAADAPTNLITGTKVHVHGTRIGGTLALASGSTSTTSSTGSFQVLQSAPLSNTLGAQNTLVILVNFQDNPGYQPVTAASVQSTAFTQTSNFYLENSDQQTSLTGDVAGWYTVAVNSTNCDTASTQTDAKAAAQAAGYNLANYKHFVYYMSSNTGCSSWWGLATIGGSDVWYNGEYGLNMQVFAHELGHNFGLYHSHSYSCGTAVICSNGTTTEYGDPHDAMAAPYNYGLSTSIHPHFNSFQKERLGWLNAGVSPPILSAGASGSYTIGPYENQDSTPKALKILQSSSAGSYYYVEFRQPIGFDSYVSSYADLMGGVVIHQAAPGNANRSDLLDMTPSGSFLDPALTVGQSFSDSTAGVTITPVSADSTGATVQVTVGTSSCTHANPSFSLSPAQSAWVVSGTTVSFTATVTNNDSSSCGSSSFSLSSTVLSGWSSSFGSSVLTLSPGTSGSTTLQVTSPTGTPDGFYNISLSVSNTSVSSYSASASATYVISTPVPISVSVSTDKSSYSSNQTVLVTVTVVSGSSPDSGASLSVTINPPKGGAMSVSGTTGSNGIATVTYTLKKRAMSGTYQVQTTASSGASSASASTTFAVQ